MWMRVCKQSSNMWIRVCKQSSNMWIRVCKESSNMWIRTVCTCVATCIQSAFVVDAHVTLFSARI